jgi:hypothetical protein
MLRRVKKLNMELKRYETFQYMEFILQKKLYVIAFTILCIVIGAVYSYYKGSSYTSTALVFTGNANNDMLSKPDLIASEYSRYLSKDSKGSFQVKVADTMEITMSANGKNKSLLESQVSNAGKKYAQDLTTHFNAQNTIMKKYAQSAQQEIDATEQSIALYDHLLANNPSTEDANNYNQALMNKQDDLTGSRADLLDVQTQLAKAEKPQLMNVTTTAASRHMARNAGLAGVFGFFVMLVILIFSKYIIDARRYDHADDR